MPRKSCNGTFEIIDNTADITFLVIAETKEELLQKCLVALACIIDDGEYEEKRYGRLSVDGSDFRGYIINALNRSILIFDTEGFLISRAEDVKIDSEHVSFEAFGYSPGSAVSGEIVKAATFHRLNYRENPYSIEITLDL